MSLAVNRHMKTVFILLVVLVVAAAAVLMKTGGSRTLSTETGAPVDSHPHSAAPGRSADMVQAGEMGEDTQRIEVAGLKAQQAELSWEIENLRKQMDDLTPLSTNGSVEPETSASHDGNLPPLENSGEEEMYALAMILDQIDFIERTIDAEIMDSEWSYEAADNLSAAMASDLNRQKVELIDADCRSTLCRLTISFDPEAIDDVFGNMQDIIPWNGEMFFQVDDIGSGEATVYVSRENYDLPKL